MAAMRNFSGFDLAARWVRSLNLRYAACYNHSDRHYAAEYSSFLRAINRFTSAQVANSRLAFFFSPR